MKTSSTCAMGLLVYLFTFAAGRADEAADVGAWVKKLGGQFSLVTHPDGGPGYEVLLPRHTSDADLKAFVALKPTRLWLLNLAPCRELSAVAVKQLRDLPALESLRVPVATTDDGVKHLAGALPNLRQLILQESKVTDAGLRPLVGLKRLSRLNLTAIQLTDACWKELAAFPALEALSVSHTPVTGKGISQLAAVKSLTDLSLGQTAVTDEAASEIAQLSGLRELDLWQRPITDAFVKKLVGLGELRRLQLYGTSVSDNAMDDLAKLTKLEAVFLGRTKVSEAGVQKLRKALPKCRVVTE